MTGMNQTPHKIDGEYAMSKGNRDNVSAITVPFSGFADLQWITVPDGSVAIAVIIPGGGGGMGPIAMSCLTVLVARNEQEEEHTGMDHLMEGGSSARCMAHGFSNCTQCRVGARQCSECSTGPEDGYHWDTCPNRIRTIHARPGD